MWLLKWPFSGGSSSSPKSHQRNLEPPKLPPKRSSPELSKSRFSAARGQLKSSLLSQVFLPVCLAGSNTDAILVRQPTCLETESLLSKSSWPSILDCRFYNKRPYCSTEKLPVTTKVRTLKENSKGLSAPDVATGLGYLPAAFFTAQNKVFFLKQINQTILHPG